MMEARRAYTDTSRRLQPLAEIEARRAELGMSISALERAAVIGKGHYHALLRQAHAARPGTVARLKMALQRYRLRSAATSEEEFLQAIAYRMCVAIAAGAMGRDAAAVHAADPARRATQDPEWMAAAQVRELAVYLMNCGAGFKQTEVAKAAGVTKQAVQLAVARVEARSDEGSPFEAMLTRLTAQIRGEW